MAILGTAAAIRLHCLRESLASLSAIAKIKLPQGPTHVSALAPNGGLPPISGRKIRMKKEYIIRGTKAATYGILYTDWGYKSSGIILSVCGGDQLRLSLRCQSLTTGPVMQVTQ